MTAWTEPALRRRAWGNYRARYLTGLSLLVLGVAATTLSSTYSLLFLVLGPALQVLGWLLLPGALWRRILVIVPGVLASLVLLAGPDFTGAFAVLLGCWLFVRHRPGLSYLALLPSVAVSFWLKAALTGYDQNWVGDLAGAATVVASAWLGRRLAVSRAGRLPPDRTTTPGAGGLDGSESARRIPSRSE